MTVKLTGNFLATARCLIYQDGNAITWSFNSNTNELTAAYTGAGSAGSANPSASVGLTAVNGVAVTWMTSDSAPALSQTIIPTWTGLHTFSAGLTVSGGTTTISGHTLVLSANATVGGTNTGDQVLPVGANPSVSVGLAAVNGSAGTWMRSDGAPALSQAIVPTWSGAHTFSATLTGNGTTAAVGPFQFNDSGGVYLGVFNSTNASGGFLQYQRSSVTKGYIGDGSYLGGAIDDFGLQAVNALVLSGGAGKLIKLLSATGTQASGPLGVNGVSPPAKVTGWGTPTGGTVVANFAAGATPSLLQMSEAVAQIISDLKAFGLYGA